MKNTVLAAIAVVATGLAATAASASTISGDFKIEICNVIGVDRDSSKALMSNFTECSSGGLGTNYAFDSLVNYEDGSIDFGTYDGSDATRIADWLATGDGTVSNLGLDLQQSKPNINKGTATTTFFLFTAVNPTSFSGTGFDIAHDDGIEVYEDGVAIGGFAGPNGERDTYVGGYGGGELSFLYVATNGDPSVLRIEAVPLPAAGFLLLGGLGGLAALKRRKKS